MKSFTAALLVSATSAQGWCEPWPSCQGEMPPMNPDGSFGDASNPFGSPPPNPFDGQPMHDGSMSHDPSMNWDPSMNNGGQNHWDPNMQQGGDWQQQMNQQWNGAQEKMQGLSKQAMEMMKGDHDFKVDGVGHFSKTGDNEETQLHAQLDNGGQITAYKDTLTGNMPGMGSVNLQKGAANVEIQNFGTITATEENKETGEKGRIDVQMTNGGFLTAEEGNINGNMPGQGSINASMGDPNDPTVQGNAQLTVEGVGEVTMDEATNSMTITLTDNAMGKMQGMGSGASKLAVSAMAGIALLMQ